MAGLIMIGDTQPLFLISTAELFLRLDATVPDA